jgi:hypothetical protein
MTHFRKALLPHEPYAQVFENEQGDRKRFIGREQVRKVQGAHHEPLPYAPALGFPRPLGGEGAALRFKAAMRDFAARKNLTPAPIG